MSRCAVNGCKSCTFRKKIHNAEENIKPPAMFTVPKSPTALAKWKSALRQDLSSKSRVCELHFDDADVKRTDDTLMPDGTIFSLPRQKFNLRKNAVPKCLVNQENKAPEIEQVNVDENVTQTVSNHESIQKDHHIVDIQYDVGNNKPGQYCYYNKKVAARFTNAPFLNHNISKVNQKEQTYSSNAHAEDTNTENSEQEDAQNDLENQVTDCEDMPPISLDDEQNSLSIQSITDYLLKSPIRRSWCWMESTKKDMGITFTQIDIQTRKVRCYVELYEDLSVMIKSGDEQVSLEIEFEIKSVEHVLNFLEIVEKAKICAGTGYDRASRHGDCNGMIIYEKCKVDIRRDRCTVCRNLRKQLRDQEKRPRVDINIKYKKIKKELDLWRRRCKNYEERLNLKNKRLKNIREMIKSCNKNRKNTYSELHFSEKSS